MTRIAPVSRDSSKDFDTVFDVTVAVMGFVPNSMLIMARDPDLLAAFAGLLENTRARPSPIRSPGAPSHSKPASSSGSSNDGVRSRGEGS